jgi:hypothetical protein
VLSERALFHLGSFKTRECQLEIIYDGPAGSGIKILSLPLLGQFLTIFRQASPRLFAFWEVVRLLIPWSLRQAR